MGRLRFFRASEIPSFRGSLIAIAVAPAIFARTQFVRVAPTKSAKNGSIASGI